MDLHPLLVILGQLLDFCQYTVCAHKHCIHTTKVFPKKLLSPFTIATIVCKTVDYGEGITFHPCFHRILLPISFGLTFVGVALGNVGMAFGNVGVAFRNAGMAFVWPAACFHHDDVKASLESGERCLPSPQHPRTKIVVVKVKGE